MNQIKLSDLSVGDWVKVGGEPARVLQLGIAGRNKTKGLSGQIYGFLTTTEIEPIPITRKILLNNGFVRNKECSYMYHNKDLGFTFEWFTKNNNTVSNSYRRGKVHIIGENIRYIHQLQHLLRFAGIDEQIKL